MVVITISRQIGSYGDEIAALAAEKLNYQLAGQEKFQEMAETCDPDFKEACNLFEKEVPLRFWERYFLREKDYTSLFEYLIYDLARLGKVVIVGRGAHLVLRDIPGISKIRIVAPQEIRVQRVMEQKSISMDKAKSMVRHVDHQRKAFIQSIYGHDPNDWQLYDQIINTESTDPEAVADILCYAVGRREPVPEEEFQETIARLLLAKQVENQIRKKIAPVSAYGPISASCVSAGTIKIVGFVPDLKNKALAKDLAEKVPGVSRVINELSVFRAGFE